MPRTASKSKPAVSEPLGTLSLITAAHVSEKATGLERLGTYVFRVNPAVTKVDVARAVEQRFKVDVRGVRIVNARPRARRVGRTVGQTPGFKKAFVTIAKGQTISGR